MQGTQVQSLVQEDPMCLRATKPECHNSWAYMPRAHALQQEKPPQWEAHTPQHQHNEWFPAVCNYRKQWRPSAVKKKKTMSRRCQALWVIWRGRFVGQVCLLQRWGWTTICAISLPLSAGNTYLQDIYGEEICDLNTCVLDLRAWKAKTVTSLVVQWLGLCISTAGGMGVIPGWGTKILTCHVLWPKNRKKKKK